MMNAKNINIKKSPDSLAREIIIDKSLDLLNDTVLFPEKVAKATEMLKKIGLPQQVKHQ